MKKYAFFDFDGTLYNGFSTNRFVIYLAGKLPDSEWALAQEKDIIDSYRSGKLNYRDGTFRITELQAKLLKGFDEAEIRNLSQEFWDYEKNNIYSWVPGLISFLKEKDYTVYLVTASITPNIEVISGLLNVDRIFSTSFVIEDGRYNGNVLQILDSDTKSEVLKEFISTIPKTNFKIGFGDSTGDIGMLALMDKSFVVNAHQEELKVMAKDKGWVLLEDGNEIINLLKYI